MLMRQCSQVEKLREGAVGWRPSEIWDIAVGGVVARAIVAASAN